VALPVAAVFDQIQTALADPGAAVLVAPPGAGKTTLVPLELLSAPWLTGKLLVLEPRRLAARAAAARMASLLGQRVGETVGVRTRGDSRVSSSTRIEVVTEGILTRMVLADPSLAGVSGVIFDEFHERSLDADLGLACCLETRALLRPDLRLLVMSATLDAAVVSRLLGDAPVIVSSGRSFPVATVWCPPTARQSWEAAVVAAVGRALREQATGDVLVFLPGVGEIRRVRGLLSSVDADVLELHGSLDAASQDAVLRSRLPDGGTQDAALRSRQPDGGTQDTALRSRQPEGGIENASVRTQSPATSANDSTTRRLLPDGAGRRRVVLATAIAQTSVTLPDVTAVVDGGLARRSRFDPRRGIGGLVTEPVSQASAEQRRGRAGRVQPGICYRVWDESTHRGLPAFDPPEIVTADLTGLALDLAAWGGLDDDRWLDPPPPGRLAAASVLLGSLGALDAAGHITDHGRRLSGLGLHPRLGHLLVRGTELGHAALAATLAALLSERDILTGPPATRPADVRERLAALRSPTSSIDRGVRDRVLADAKRFSSRVTNDFATKPAVSGQVLSQSPTDDDAAGLLIGLAFPDRLARRRATGARFVLASGGGAALDANDPLARETFLAIAELDVVGGNADARVSMAAPLDVVDIETILGDRLVWEDDVRWDRRTRDVVATRQRRFSSLVVEEDHRATASPALASAALLEGIRIEGVELLHLSDETQRWRERVTACRSYLSDTWPDVSDEALLSTMNDWLAPLLSRCVRRADLARVDTNSAVRSLLPWPLSREIDELVPTHLTVPSGSRIAIDYAAEIPTMAVKLQELFGLSQSPQLAGGRIPLVIHLLSPARRPLQVTSDLASFWSTGYPSLRAEMRGKYPRHPWPENPTTATPTAKVTPRKK
jgi:ATP-dependent helicase HrpB